MIASAPPDMRAAIDRFADDWARLWPDRPVAGLAPDVRADVRVGLAVSGGPDSMALMLLANAALGAGAIMVATVDHGLRADSAAEADLVAGLCAARGIAHQTLRLALTPGTAVQERARIARYRALADWCRDRRLGALVTAHHADDQVETMVMRLNRGAGLRGLSAMRARAVVPGSATPASPGSQAAVPLLRPLLGWRRTWLLTVVAQAGVTAAADPSNHDRRFERVRVRDGLAAATWLDPAGLAMAAWHLARADAALDWAAAQITPGSGATPGEITLEPGLPQALALRVLERVVARLTAATPRGRDLAHWHDRLVAGEVATLAGVRGDGRAAPWRFTRAARPAIARSGSHPR